MSVSSGGSGRDAGGLSLDQWIALNDEIAALVGAGLPLEPGLAGVAGDARGRLGATARALADRLERGESLPAAIAAEGDRLPPVYRAVVTAGARSGRLGAALEGLTTAARNHAELRRVVGLALTYPLIVVALAYVLFVGFLMFVLPRFVSTFESFRLPGLGLLHALGRVGESAWYWWPAGLVVLAAIALWWAWSGRAGSFPGSSGVLSWVPWMRGLMRQSATASFADLTALLVEHDVPLPDAVELAGRSAGNADLERASESLAAGLRGGQGELTHLPHGFPPLLGWLMAYGNRQGQLAPALRHAGETYRRRAWLEAEVLRTFLPIVLMIVVGATAVLAYGLLLFVPFSTLLNQLSESLN
jgi:general secretion pathway protein F